MSSQIESTTRTFSTRRAWSLAALAGLGLYVATMAPGLLWGDSGDAQIRVLTGALTDARELARAHAPYYAVAIGLHRLTGADAAWVANLVAALAGAVTVANFAWLLTHFVRRLVPLVAGTAMLLLSHTLWQLSTGAEVVTFSTMCLSFELAAVVSYLTARKPVWLVLAVLANGIGWSTHNMALLTWPAYVVLIVMEWRRRPSARVLIWAGMAWLVGALPLIVLAVQEYWRLGSAGETLRSLLIGRYGQKVFNTNVSLGLLARVVIYGVMNFPTPLILVAPWGWWRLRTRTPGSAWWFLTVSMGVFMLFTVRYRVPDQYTFFVHAYLFLVLFAAVGIDGVLDRWPSRRLWVFVLGFSALGPPVYAVAPAIARGIPATHAVLPGREIPYREPYTWFLCPWRTGYGGAEQYAREVFQALPADAALIMDETMRSPLTYLQKRDGIRPDVCVPEPRYSSTEGCSGTVDAAGAAQLIEDSRLFCASTVPTSLPKWLRSGAYRFESTGLVYRVTRHSAFPP
ncbi:MAG: DUF2723 domain-containing protein [Phycisphaerae bacterium]|nr:DUF2723 domain-containing protein [Phycisphaerae bacterium]